MKLRQKSKRDQALDAVASIAKTWSEWRLGEKVTKTAAKGAKKASKTAKQAAKKKGSSGTTKRKPIKLAGVIALICGIGAAVAKKVRGGKAEPLYTPPDPGAQMADAPPSPGAVGNLTQDPPPAVNRPIEPTVEPASTVMPPLHATRAVEDLAGAAPGAAGAAEAPGAPQGGSSADVAPEPEDIISEAATEPEADKDAGETTADAGGASDEPADRPL